MTATDYAANVKAREDAEFVMSYIQCVAEPRPQRFWEVLADLVNAKLPPKPAPIERLPALTEQEAIRFERLPMPWGNHYGKPVGEVPPDYLLFVTEGDEFSQRLKRYVKSQRFAARQE